MEPRQSAAPPTPEGLAAYEVKVLLVDDQAMVGEAVRRMLAPESDIRFRYCSDPAAAIQTAEAFAPTVILQDLVMPDLDGLTLVKFFRAHPRLRDTPLIVLSTKEEPTVKAEAFALGANDYLVKLPDRVELIARIRHHSQGYIRLLERNEAYQALLESQRALAKELAEAAAYVQALLPPPLEGPIRTEWRFIPSAQLGGDAFGYHWLDADHFGLFLLDVCGHGVGAALLSISAMNVLRAQALPEVTFLDPGATLTALNAAFPMEQHRNMYFTIWYGVYECSTRTLRFSSAGHPPALLIHPAADGPGVVEELYTRGMVLGGMPDVVYQTEARPVPRGASLFLLSDGTYEIPGPNGKMWTFAQFVTFLNQTARGSGSALDALWKEVEERHGTRTLPDDYSIVKVDFPD